MGERSGEESAEVAVTFAVPEMDCPSCAGKVDKSLQRVEGLIEADLRPTTGMATLSYDPDVVTEDDLARAIESAGYEISDRPAGEKRARDISPPSAVWTSDRAMKTWVGAVFLTAGLLLEFVLPALNPVIVVTPLFGFSIADIAFIVAVVSSGVPVVRSGYYSARQRSVDIDLLMGTAIVAATGIGLFIEAATLAVLFSIAELLERYAMDQTRDSLRELIELAPQEARMLEDGDERSVPVDAVTVGQRVAVRPGEQIPIDGVVIKGQSAVDQSPITGESVPVDKEAGDDVFAGTINEAGYLEIEVTSRAADSTLSRIIELVSQAQAEKTETEQFVDRFASYYTPVVVVLAIFTAVVPPLAIDGATTIGVAGISHTFVDAWRTWFVRGLTLLVIACPCAFVISTPVSVASGVTAAARNGVLIKGGTYLEAMGAIDAIAFDKTGTLTKGNLVVTDIASVDATDESVVLRFAGALEQRSEHPIADAILECVADEGLDVPEVTAFRTIPGKGVRADLDGITYYAGKPGLFAELGFDVGADRIADGGLAGSSAEPAWDAQITSQLEREGKSIVVVGSADRLLGIIGIADEIRPEARGAITRLRELGVGPLVMLTGDNEGTARTVADELVMDEYRAELLPEEKVEAVQRLEETYGNVAMVGDGINDAPAMAVSSVGIAMGAAGTDTAIETADIALMEDKIGRVPYLYSLSHKANGVIRENIWSSLSVKFLLALGVPFGYVSVALAVLIGDMGMSLGVTGNAMRLSRITPDR